jgi:Domain of unknown function (DUF222)
MRSDSGGGREAVVAVLDRLDADLAELAALALDGLTHLELLTVLARLESRAWRTPALVHRILARLQAEASPVELGATSMAAVLSERLRISRDEAHNRLKEAADLGPRRSLSGEPLAPKLTHTAAAQARGQIGPEHVRIIRRFFDDLPDAVDFAARERADATLARIACEQLPDGLRKAAARLLALLHPDGDFSDVDRARRRGITVGPQGPDGLSKINGLLDPEGRATWDAVMAAKAARGKCNPDDPNPCVDGDPGERAHTDQRTLAQRQHDALTAVGRAMLASGQLGSHHGLPATIIVSTTLQDLESASGHAVTGGGTLLPMRDVIRLASHAHHYLTVFDEHTREALYLGRTRRCASPGQRIVLYSLHGGCTKPGCSVPPYGCEVHHAARDWNRGGQTNIDELTLACKPDNLLVENTGWTTRIRKDGRTEWIPPPHLDTGQTRVNDYHHPERMLAAPDPDPDPDPGEDADDAD